uniref:Uncharacterized protein n=1 Tax=Rhizophora mucronata TaxID=61149 RepID=A0A2P2P847_RHIMU
MWLQGTPNVSHVSHLCRFLPKWRWLRQVKMGLQRRKR